MIQMLLWELLLLWVTRHPNVLTPVMGSLSVVMEPSGEKPNKKPDEHVWILRGLATNS